MRQHHGKGCSRSCLPPLPRSVLRYIPATLMDNLSFRLSRLPYPLYGGVQTYLKTMVHQFIFYRKTSSSTSLQIARSVPRSLSASSIVGDSAPSYDTLTLHTRPLVAHCRRRSRKCRYTTTATPMAPIRHASPSAWIIESAWTSSSCSTVHGEG
jgi:hypothetical protein